MHQKILKERLKGQYQLIQPVTSFECPVNFFMIEGGSETVQTVIVPSVAPQASISEDICPNFITVTANTITTLTELIKKDEFEY